MRVVVKEKQAMSANKVGMRSNQGEAHSRSLGCELCEVQIGKVLLAWPR